MVRIGIIGSESSHAEAFSSMLNKINNSTGVYRYPNFKVTAIFGEEDSGTKEIARTCNIPLIVKDIHEMLLYVDAVMIVLRDGNLHLPYATPFLEAKIPVWIDKPFTVNLQDCNQLLHLAKTHGTLITGGSTCMYMEGVKIAKQYVQYPSRLGEIQGGTMNYPADTESEYGGFYFYAPHLCEMCLQIFGYDPISVIALENNGSVFAVVRYPKYSISLNFLKDATEHMIIINGSNSTLIQELDSPELPYYNGFDEFAGMLLNNKQPLTYSQLYTSVALMNAIRQSYQEKKEVQIEHVKEF